MKQKVSLSPQNEIVSVISRKSIKFLVRNTWAAHSDQHKQQRKAMMVYQKTPSVLHGTTFSKRRIPNVLHLRQMLSLFYL